MTTTFHPFPCLPFELRARIWELTVEPRTVHVEVLLTRTLVPNPAPLPRRARGIARHPSHVTNFVSRLASPTPVPATLQTCREARNLGLYQRAFSELTKDETRYVWLNLDIDTIFIGQHTRFKQYKPVAHLIQRLKFERDYSEDSFYYSEASDLPIFSNTREIHVICANGLESWYQASTERYWACGRENLFFFDKLDGRIMNSVELDEMCDREVRKSLAAQGYYDSETEE